MKWTILFLCCLLLLSCGTGERERGQWETDAEMQTQTAPIIAADTEPVTHELYGYIQDEQPTESQTPDAESPAFPMEYLMDVHALLIEHMIDLQIVGVGVSEHQNKVTIDVASAEHIASIEEFLNQEQIDAECYDICVSGPIVPCDSVGEEPRLELAVEPKVVVRGEENAEIVLTVTNAHPLLLMYGHKSYPIYYWDEAENNWIGDPDNFGLTTDEGVGFVGTQEIPITLDLDGFYANDGVYMIAFKAREAEEPKREYMETVTFQIKREVKTTGGTE